MGDLVNLDLMESIYVKKSPLDEITYGIVVRSASMNYIISTHESEQEAQKQLLVLRIRAKLPVAEYRSERQDE